MKGSAKTLVLRLAAAESLHHLLSQTSMRLMFPEVVMQDSPERCERGVHDYTQQLMMLHVCLSRKKTQQINATLIDSLF